MAFGASSEAEFQGFRERLLAYMLKASQEAKVHTSWVNPNEEYVGAVRKFLAAALDPGEKNLFLEDVRDFQRRIASFGYWNLCAASAEINLSGRSGPVPGKRVLGFEPGGSGQSPARRF